MEEMHVAPSFLLFLSAHEDYQLTQVMDRGDSSTVDLHSDLRPLQPHSLLDRARTGRFGSQEPPGPRGERHRCNHQPRLGLLEQHQEPCCPLAPGTVNISLTPHFHQNRLSVHPPTSLSFPRARGLPPPRYVFASAHTRIAISPNIVAPALPTSPVMVL